MFIACSKGRAFQTVIATMGAGDIKARRGRRIGQDF